MREHSSARHPDRARARGRRRHPPTQRRSLITVTIANSSHTPAVAFFLRADVRRGTVAGVPAPGDDELAPVLRSDNDTTLWPGETETLTAAYSSAGLDGQQPVIAVSD